MSYCEKTSNPQGVDRYAIHGLDIEDLRLLIRLLDADHGFRSIHISQAIVTEIGVKSSVQA